MGNRAANQTDWDRCLIALAAGDQEAFQKVYEEFYKPVFLLAVSLTGQVEMAEDVAQEVFLTVRSCAGSYEPRGQARAWIFGITKNVARYFWRRSRPEQEGDEALETIPTKGELEAGVLGNLLVSRALSELSPAEYPVVVLHVFGGLSLREIAEQYEIPYGTVLWRYGEAKKRLRRFFRRTDGEERRDLHEKI